MPTPMIDSLGVVHDVPEEHVAARAAMGWRPQTFEDVLAASTAAAKEEAYGGFGGGLKAAGLAGLRGATLGLSDVAARALGGDDAAIALEGYKEENPGISFAGELGGAIAPALVTGGAGLFTGAGAATAKLGAGAGALGAERLGAGLARAGARIGEIGAEGGALSRLGESAIGRAAEYAPSSLVSGVGRGASEAVGGGLRGALAAGATEGALYGAGSGVSELALEQDPLTWERAATTIGSSALFGAAGGAALGAAGNVVERGLHRASEAIDAAVARSAAKAKPIAGPSEIPEYAALKAQVERPASSGPEGDIAEEFSIGPQAGAAGSAQPGSFAERFDQAFRDLDTSSGGNNSVTVHDLRRAMPDLSRDEFDAALRDLRRKKLWSMDSADGAGLSDEIRAAGIKEAGGNLTYVQRGPNYRPTYTGEISGARAIESHPFEIGDDKFSMAVETRPVVQGGAPREYVTVTRDLGDGTSKVIATAEFSQRGEDLHPNWTAVDSAWRRKGIASRMYDAAEKRSGRSVIASESQTDDGAAFSSQYRSRRSSKPTSTPTVERIDAGGKKLYLTTETKPNTPGGLPRTKVTVTRQLADGEEVAVAKAEFIHLDAGLYPDNVDVIPGLQRNGIATRMYEAAERASGKLAIPSDNQTAAGKAFSAKYRGNRVTGPDYVEQTLPASQLAERGYFEPPGAGVDPARVMKARNAIIEGQREPIDLTVSPSGKIGVVNGRHRLDAAIDLDKPVNVRWYTGEEPSADMVHRAGPPPDVSNYTATELRKAEEAEKARLRTKQAPQRQAFVDELDQYRNANRDAHVMREVPKASPDRDIKEAGGAFANNDMKLRALLDDRIGLADDPGRALVLLRKQRQALEEIVPWAKEQQRLWQRDVAEAPEKIKAALRDISSRPTLAERVKAAKEYAHLGIGGEKTGPFTEAGLDTATAQTVDELKRLSWGGAANGALKEPAVSKLVPEYERVLAWNAKFQTTLDELVRPPTSELLTRIAAARDALGAPKPPPSAGEAVLGAAAALSGPVGAAAAAGTRIMGGFKKLIGNVVERTAKATAAILDAASHGVKATAPYAPVLATKVLASLRYGPSKSAKSESLPELYKARTDEIKQLTAYDEMGVPRLRPEVRQQIGGVLRPIAAVDPTMADRIETALAARIEYLSSIIPRRPDIAGIQTGPDRWQPSDMAMRSWARSAAAAEDPYAVLERAVHGGVTPEDAATMRAVHPEILADFAHRVTSELPTLRQALPYDQQLSISILTGVPVAAALDPKVLGVLQGQFPAEPGSSGGTAAPKAQPQFGSIKQSVSQPTPAQSRAQGAHA